MFQWIMKQNLRCKIVAITLICFRLDIPDCGLQLFEIPILSPPAPEKEPWRESGSTYVAHCCPLGTTDTGIFWTPLG